MRPGNFSWSGIGLVVALLWLFVIYLPRRTAEGEVATAARFKDLEERD
ncbi:MAG TPA: hypothetical protein VFE21_02560 [Rubrobacteraceae bacterium]|nr:hypothetical protein [Rubrobacteraceae bacterium]